MTILLLLIIFLLCGFLLAMTGLGDQIVSLADELTDQVRGFRQPETVQSYQPADSDLPVYREWLVTALEVPDDLRIWYLNLDDRQAQGFENALHDHGLNTGLQLASLVAGNLDGKPALRSIYVEAVAIYSQAYRKAREAIAVEKDSDQSAAETTEPEPDSRVEGKVVAEKRTSRRRINPAPASTAPAA
jgi:hypothetical protein